MARILSVTELNNLVKMAVESSPLLHTVNVVGEVVGVTVYSRQGKSSTWFTLKDANAELSCVYWSVSDIKQGDQVEVVGRVAVWTGKGKYQLIANKISRVGDGLEKEKLEKLVAELEKKGYFDPRNKKNIPAIIKKVALVTSEEGAAVGDVCKTLENRGSVAVVCIYDVRVQGQEAALQIAEALNSINSSPDEADVIVLTRGGGGKEDLAVFNDLACFEAIHDSRIPVICAIGHERDLSIAERCADKHCITPTDAAIEVAVRSSRAMYFAFAVAEWNEISEKAHRFLAGVEREFLKIKLVSPEERLRAKERVLEALASGLSDSVYRIFERKQSLLENLGLRVEAASPFKILERGYALVYSNSRVVTAAAVKPGERIEIMTKDGNISADVVEVSNEDIRRKIGRA